MPRIDCIGPNGERRKLSGTRLARMATRGWCPVADAHTVKPVVVAAVAPVVVGVNRSLPVVIHVVPWDLTTGGTQRMVDQWCRYGGGAWDVHIVAPGLRGDFTFPGSTVHHGTPHSEVMAKIKAIAPDLIVHHGSIRPYGHYAKCPVVWVAHSEQTFAAPKAKWCDPAATLSNYMPETMASGWGDDDVQPIPLGVDLEKFTPKARPLVAGIVGRVSEEKIPHTFVNALLAWGNPGGAWEIRIVGNGIGNPFQGKVKKQCKDIPWIRFAGDSSPDDMPSRYAEFDALLVPSATETGSYAIVEALACGVPVVARNVGGIPYTCGGAARLCDDDSEFFDALRDLEDRGTRGAMATRSRQEAERRHNVIDHAEAHSVAYRLALGWPVFDVLFPVFNTPARWIRIAVDSILNQTHAPGKVVLIDDGSDDAETVAELDDLAEIDGVELLRLDENGGIAAGLNAGLVLCDSKFVARMDPDDISKLDRFAKQARYLAANPDTTVLGGQLLWMAKPGQTNHAAVVTRESVQDSTWFLNHPTVVFNRQAVLDVGGYPIVKAAQDLALWLQLLNAGAVIRNLPDTLVQYRTHKGQETAQGGFAALVADVNERFRR